MSAFQVTGKHIAVMVDAFIKIAADNNFHRSPDTSKRAELCKMLAEENAKSVNYRYQAFKAGAVTEFPEFNEKVLREFSFMVLLKVIDCYEYQACEHEGWKDSEARKFCAKLYRMVIQSQNEWRDCDGWGLT